MNHLVSKRIEKACADLNNFPTSSSTSDVQQALATFGSLNCLDPTIYEKAVGCQVFDGLIKVINPPKNHELHKDIDGIFTNEKDGILQRGLVLFLKLIKMRQATLVCIEQRKSQFPLFPQLKELLDNLKKVLERTAKPISLPQTSNNKKNDSNNSQDDDDRIDAERKKATTNNELLLNETILIRIRASTRVLAGLQWLEPRVTEDPSGALGFEELLILEGFHLLALKNIAFGLEALKSATISRNTNNDEQHAGKGNKMLTTTIAIFMHAAAQTLRASFEFDFCGRDRVVSKTRWEAVRKLVIHHNLVPFLFHAISVVDDHAALPGIDHAATVDDLFFLHSSLRALLNCAKTNPTEEQLKKWNLPVNEKSIIGRRIVQGGFLRSLLRFANLDSIDTVPQKGEVEYGPGGSRALIQHRVLLLLRAIGIEEKYFQAFLELDGIAILTKLMDHESQEIRFLTMVMVSTLCSAQTGWNDRANIAELFISCGIIQKISRIGSSKAHDLSSRNQAMSTMMIIVYFLRTDEFPAFNDEQEKKQQQERIAELHLMLIEQKLHIAVADAVSVFMTEDWIDKPQSDPRDELSIHVFEIAYDLLENAPTKEQAKQILEVMCERDIWCGLTCYVVNVLIRYMHTFVTPLFERRRVFIRKYFPELVKDNNGNKKTTDDEVKSESK